jgi:hypothetical protein
MMKTFLRGCVWLLVLTTLGAAHSLAQTQTTPAAPAPRPSPCPVKPEYKQFDFWMGEWDVTDKGQKIATSSIQRIVGDCIIFENYFQLDGYTGKSFSFFDATLGKWRQTWVDSSGNVGEFLGEYRENAMRYEGETHRSDGQKILRRMTLFNLGADRVRQYSERSLDGGKTWAAGYDFIYIRRK